MDQAIKKARHARILVKLLIKLRLLGSCFESVITLFKYEVN